MAGGVAHDFNNMLGVIIGYSDLAHGVIEPESPANRHMEQIKKASQRAVGLNAATSGIQPTAGRLPQDTGPERGCAKRDDDAAKTSR